MPRDRQHLIPSLVSIAVGTNGLFIIFSILLAQFRFDEFHISSFLIDLPLLFGLTLLYLSLLLRKRKLNAWIVTVLVYAFMLGTNVMQLVQNRSHFLAASSPGLVRLIVLPLVVVIALALSKNSFVVKSDPQTFRSSLKFSLIVMLIAFLYGVVGFSLMDVHDFHRELSLSSAAHHTIDQFGLTTNDQLRAYTRRARIFQDSLAFMSIGAVAYVAISFFAPLRSRAAVHHSSREIAIKLVEENPLTSDDYFKLWPPDKAYFFNQDQSATLAYKVEKGVAMVVSDPIGPREKWDRLVKDFEEYCFPNDWQPAFIHTESRWSGFYKKHGYSQQKIGQEAIVDINNFMSNVMRNKYFRHINNKFSKQGFTAEILMPPHNQALIARLKTISDEWLGKPGRAERQMMMGYFSEEYLQTCPIIVVRDGASTIQAFANQVRSFDGKEATYDMMRHSRGSMGNINDFLLIKFLEHLHAQGYERLNMGLCPLTGLDKTEEGSLINSALQLVYANGDRFYSFSGLHRFKAKYEPEWNDRYVVYKGGIMGFSRTMNALIGAMKVKGSDKVN